MTFVCARLRSLQAIVCLLIGLFSFTAGAQPVEVFEQTEDEPGIVAYPPLDRSAPRPVTVMLHGMCSEPERACRHFASTITITREGWLLCPRATRRCDGGGSIWPQHGFDQQIEAGIERVNARHPNELDDGGGRTLIGFSLGAFRALDMAHGGRGRYPRVILIGAKIYPEAERLRMAGVQRLLLAAGDWDMMRTHMQGRTRALVRRGFTAAFQSYGAVGHAFPANFPELLRRGLDWTRGEDTALASGT
jgi:predicted esterase